jgi:hypothetical protein
LTRIAGRALISDQAINNRQVTATGQACSGSPPKTKKGAILCLERLAGWTAGATTGNAEMAGVGRKPNTGQPTGSEAGDHAYMTMVARAKALIPQLRDRAANMPVFSGSCSRNG